MSSSAEDFHTVRQRPRTVGFFVCLFVLLYSECLSVSTRRQQEADWEISKLSRRVWRFETLTSSGVYWAEI